MTIHYLSKFEQITRTSSKRFTVRLTIVCYKCCVCLSITRSLIMHCSGSIVVYVKH